MHYIIMVVAMFPYIIYIHKLKNGPLLIFITPDTCSRLIWYCFVHLHNFPGGPIWRRVITHNMSGLKIFLVINHISTIAGKIGIISLRISVISGISRKWCMISGHRSMAFFCTFFVCYFTMWNIPAILTRGKSTFISTANKFSKESLDIDTHQCFIMNVSYFISYYNLL